MVKLVWKNCIETVELMQRAHYHASVRTQVRLPSSHIKGKLVWPPIYKYHSKLTLD